MAEASEPSLGKGAKVAGYEIVERIGVGGFGEVFRARQPVIGREVAIKVLYAKYSADPEAVARFIAEARAVNKISHAGIVEVFDFGKLPEGREFHVMELLGGQTLRDLLAERGHVPLQEAIPLLRGIAEAIDAAHAAGIAHRDLKPDNVFVLEDGRIKVIDFGLAKLMHDEDSVTTRDGSVFGTPMYMSPEQCRGNAIDTRTDLYSFGVLAYHLLVGEPPFTGDAIELALHHVNDRPVQPSKRNPELPRYVDHVLLSLLAKDPVDRPASLGTAVSALEGSISLRRIRARHLRRLALVAVLGTALGFGIRAAVSRPTEHVATGAERIAEFWNPSVRAVLAKRFVGRDDIVAWGKVEERTVDDLTTAWATQWDRAIHSGDRRSDPLLYAQRVTCLETVLLDLRAQIASAQVTPPDQQGAWSPDFGRTLADCDDPVVLRAQVPAPPQSLRPTVTALILDAYSAADEAMWGAGERVSLEDAIARLDAIAHSLELLHPPSATLPLLARTQILTENTWDVAARLPKARAALADAIPRIERTRDDVAVADIYITQAWFLLYHERDGDNRTAATEALERAEAAAARAGNPRRLRRYLLTTRARLQAVQGKFAEAVVSLRASEELLDPTGMLLEGGHYQLPQHLVLAGHNEEAIATDRERIERLTRELGSDILLDPYRVILSVVCEAAGDLECAMSEQTLVIDNGKAVHDPPYALAWGQIWRAELALRLGRADEHEVLDAVHGLASRGTTPHLQSPDGMATARRAGAFEPYAFAAEHELANGSDETLDAAAYLAFARGDTARANELGKRMADACTQHSCATWIRRARWFALASGPSLQPTLAKLEAEYGGDRTALAASGVALAVAGQWDAARKKLEAARAIPNVWERQSDLLELDGWLGLAQLRAGDTAAARASFEEGLDAMSILHNGIEGFDYMLPVVKLALADILWNAPDGDRPRAIRLATQARDGFKRLGSLHDAQRADAEKWLAAHSL